MLSWLIDLLGWRKLETVLNKKKTVKISGVKFIIKKINPLDHLEGSKVMLQSYDVYKIGMNKGNQEYKQSEKKIKEHLANVIVSGVLEPKIVHKGEGILVEDLFSDWNLVNELYEQIITFTYGKKKLLKS